MIRDIINAVKDNEGLVTIAILLIGSLIEISPIKINPISYFGKLLNRDLAQQVHDLKDDLNTHKIDSQRSEILHFANSCMHHVSHTKEEFDYILKVHDEYAEYIEDNHLKNGQVDSAYLFITELYNKLLREDGFL